MQIQINPRSLLNLTHICEVLYKLHPSVLDVLVEMERSLGGILGTIDLNNVSLEEREFLSKNYKEEDYSMETEESITQEEFNEMLESKGVKVTKKTFDNKNDVIDFINDYKDKNKHKNVKILFGENFLKEDNTSKLLKTIEDLEEDKNAREFHNLRKYIQLDTDEYIPMKIYVEVEDPVIGRKVKELVEALEKTRAPEQFFLNKKEIDEDAYFAEGYNLTINDEQKKQRDDFFYGDVEGLKSLLKREKLYP